MRRDSGPGNEQSLFREMRTVTSCRSLPMKRVAVQVTPACDFSSCVSRAKNGNCRKFASMRTISAGIAAERLPEDDASLSDVCGGEFCREMVDGSVMHDVAGLHSLHARGDGASCQTMIESSCHAELYAGSPMADERRIVFRLKCLVLRHKVPRVWS